MDGDTAYLVGRAFARVLARPARQRSPASCGSGSGRDMRLEAPEMAGRVRDGLVAEGCAVLDAGMVATEMLYYLVGSRELDGGAMVTASHNPKAYTGRQARPRGRAGALGRRRDRRRARHDRGRAAGAARRRDGRGGRRLRRLPPPRALASSSPTSVRPLRVVVDGGNGMAGPMVGPLLERLGLDLVTTYWVPDGEFPDHEPNPLLAENRQFIIDRVLEEGADLGIAWDGDADRCFFIDDRGEFVRRRLPDRAARAAGAAQGAGRDDPLRRSRQPRGARHGARAGRHARTSTASATPSSRSRCASTRAAFGGEVSGHYYFRDFWCADSGTIPALLVLELLSVEDAAAVGAGRRASASATSSPARSTPRSPTRRRRCRSSPSATPTARSRWLDGVSVDYPDWHFNVRPSNTEPLLRLNLESLVSREDMERSATRCWR